jgi:membrane protein
MSSSVPANALPRKSPWRLRLSSVTALLRQVWTSSYEDGVYNRAAELAYFFFLSLVPGVIFITTLLGFVFKSNAQLTVLLLQYLGTTLPGSAFELIRQVITEITRSSGSGKLTFGILAALWTANSGMNSLEDALNAVYKVKESRALWKTYGIALILTVSASMLIIAALTVFLYGGALIQLISNTIGLKPALYWIWKLAQWPIAVFFVSLVASMVYYAAFIEIEEGVRIGKANATRGKAPREQGRVCALPPTRKEEALGPHIRFIRSRPRPRSIVA